MAWTKVTKSPGSHDAGDDGPAAPSRRDVLARIGLAGAFAIAGPSLFAIRPAEAHVNTPAIEPNAAAADAAETEAAGCNAPEQDLADLDNTEFTEVSAQWRRRYWRRRYWRRRYWRRRYWRRRYWRRRYWWRCRWRWYRGRRVRVCRRVWW